MNIQLMKKGAKAGWALSALVYLGGLLAMWMGGEFLSVSYMSWYWNALVLGILTIGVKVGILIMMKSERA